MAAQSKKKPPRNQLANLIIKDVNSGVLPSGSWLKQIDLEQRYGCSRLDVRRALDELVIKQVVTHLPNRGYYVQAPDLQQLSQTREVRIVLECAAVDDLVITEADFCHLEVLAQRFRDLVYEGTSIDRHEVNVQFHEYLYSRCRNQELTRLIHELRNRNPSAPFGSRGTHARSEQSALEHFEIIRALSAGKLDQAKRLITAHIRWIPIIPD